MPLNLALNGTTRLETNMTTPSLNSVTLATIENYRDAANQAARAYQLGTQRLISALNGRLEKTVDGRIDSIAPQLNSRIVTARSRVTDIVVKGIDELTKRTGRAVDLGYDNAAAQVNKLAKLVGGIDSTTVVNGLAAVARLSLPAAKVGLTVSSKLVDGVQALASAVQGDSAKAAADAAVKTPVRKATRVQRQTATVSRKAVKAVKAVKAAVAAPKQTAVHAKRKLVSASAAA